MDIYRRIKHVRRWFWIILALTIILLTATISYYPNYYQAKVMEQQKPTELTAATTRIPGSNPIEVAVAIAQTVYPATFSDNKPGAVILVPVDDWQTAVLATEISHFPINAPILYTERDHIPKLTLEEIKRLDPEGVFQDGNIKILLIGDLKEGVKKQLKKEKLKFRVLSAKNIEELASLLDDYKAMIHVNHDDEVIIVPKDTPALALLASSWVAHMGHSIFFVDKNGIAEITKHSLSKRPQDAYLYVLADDKTIPPRILEELSPYGHVQRIHGNNPWTISVGFAGYKDVGPNFGWWIRRSTRSFGWGIAEAGHNFTLVNPAYPEIAIPAAILSHMGKHGPFLLVNEEGIPEPVSNYLKTVRPTFTSSQEQLFNFAWVIGNQEIISSKVQQETDNLLQVKW